MNDIRHGGWYMNWNWIFRKKILAGTQSSLIKNLFFQNWFRYIIFFKMHFSQNSTNLRLSAILWVFSKLGCSLKKIQILPLKSSILLVFNKSLSNNRILIFSVLNFICWWEIKRFSVNHVSGLKCDVTVSFFHRLLDLMFFLTFAYFDHHPYPRSEKLNEVEDYYKT